MKKLQSITKDTTETFDETLRKLFEKKIRCEMAIYQVNHHNHTHTHTQVLLQDDILCSNVHCVTGMEKVIGSQGFIWTEKLCK